MAERSGLPGSEVLKLVYEKITKDGKELILPVGAMSEIANDSDGHRDRIGYVCYKSVVFKQIEGRLWLFSFGKKLGGYVTEPFDCDIAAMPLEIANGVLDDGLINLASYALSKNYYYSYSLMCSLSCGDLVVSTNGSYLVPFLDTGINLRNFTLKELEYDLESDYILASTAKPPIKSKALYKENLVDALVEGFKKVLIVYRPDPIYKIIMSHAPIND